MFTNEQRRQGSQSGTVIWATVAAALGIVGLVGWFLRIDELRAALPHYPPMHPLTAVTLMLGASSLGLFSTRPAAARAIALFIVVIVFLRLTSSDQVRAALLEIFPSAPVLSPQAGKMGVNTAVVLGAFACAVLTISSKRVQLRHLPDALAVLGIFLAGMVLTGYVLNVAPLYRLSTPSPMSIPTALGLTALMLGVLSLPRYETFLHFMFDDGSAGRLARTLLPIAAIVQAGIAVLRLSGQAAGLFDREAGIALHLSASIAATLGLVGYALYSLAQSDLLRRQREEELRLVRATLLDNTRLNAMGTMAAALAHELNQPLAALANYAAGLRRLTRTDGNNEQIKDGLLAMESTAQRAADIIRRLREITQPGTASAREFNLRELLSATVDAARRSCGSISINLKCEADRVAVADPEQVEQALKNVLQNACDAAGGRDEGRVEVSCHEIEGGVEITIVDNGTGIAVERLPTLFDVAKSSKPNGMGIGLAISRTLLEANNGRIEGSNDIHGGARFRIKLPAGK